MNNTDNNFLSQILSIALIVMVVLLFILLVVYLILRLKKYTEKTSNTNSQNQDIKRQKADKKVSSYSKRSIMDFMEFDDVQDNMIIQKNGKRFLMVVECQGVNYDLMSGLEKNAVEEGFQQFLNTLRHPIQIYIQTRTVNLEKSLSTYEKTVSEIEDRFNKMKFEYENMVESNAYSQEQLDKYFYNLTKQKNLYEYAKDIVFNTEKMSNNKNILNKQYYIIIPYFVEESDNKYDKEEIKNMAFSELYTKAQAIIRTLSACSVTGKVLTSYELVDLLYVAYNRDQAEIFGTEKALMSGYDELYSTSRDVFEKKIELLDREIEKRAVDLANEKITKVKSELQEKAEEKQDNMDELINEMAQILLEENERVIGSDVVDAALKELKEEKPKRGRKGGKINGVIQEKQTRRLKSTK